MLSAKDLRVRSSIILRRSSVMTGSFLRLTGKVKKLLKKKYTLRDLDQEGNYR